MGAIDGVFNAAAAATGAHPSYFKMLACFFISYPLGSVFVRLPKDRPAIKHLFSIGVTMFFLWPMLDLLLPTLNILGSAMFTYFMAATVKGKIMPWTVFGVVMSHMLVLHYVRWKWPTEAVEISGPQMVLTMKLSTFAWNIYDGQQKLEDLDASQKETRIPKLPSLLEYLGYVFYFPAFLVGPSLTYTDYMALVNETLYDGVQVATANGTKSPSKRVPYGRKRVAYQKLALGVFCMGIFAVYDGSFTYAVGLTEWWSNQPLWYRILHTQAMGTVQRSKYYGAWLLTEGACIFTGLGFNGFDKNGKALWDKAANVDIPNIELGPNFKVLLDSWNINTNVWLRNSVYKRLVPIGKKPTAITTMETFLTSAIWHGIYPGYYLTFITGGMFSSASKYARSFIRPFFLPALLSPKAKNLPPPTLLKRLYDVSGTVITLMITNYLAAPFLILSLRDSIRFWGTIYFYGHVIMITWLLWGNFGGFKMLNQKLKARAAAASGKEAEKIKGDAEEREKALKAGTPVGPGAITPSSSGPFMVPPDPLDFANALKVEGIVGSQLADGGPSKKAL